MKKFRFSLETVLDYKQQVLNALMGEYGALQEMVVRQERVLAQTEQSHWEQNRTFRQKERVGITITEAMLFENGLRSLEAKIQREGETLTRLQKQAEEKRSEMVEAKKETASLEKLREKKLDIHHKAEQKSEEAFVEEFVSAVMAMETRA